MTNRQRKTERTVTAGCLWHFIWLFPACLFDRPPPPLKVANNGGNQERVGGLRRLSAGWHLGSTSAGAA